jgi:hypothetical protein
MYSCNDAYCTVGTGSASYGVSLRTSSFDTATLVNTVVPVPVRRCPKPSQSSISRTPSRSTGTATVATESWSVVVATVR